MSDRKEARNPDGMHWDFPLCFVYKVVEEGTEPTTRTGYDFEKLTIKVLREGLEPSSLAACDFESHVYTIPPPQHFNNEYFNY